MPFDDYDADATELLETYGLSIIAARPHLTFLADFLMKYIIIGNKAA